MDIVQAALTLDWNQLNSMRDHIEFHAYNESLSKIIEQILDSNKKRSISDIVSIEITLYVDNELVVSKEKRKKLFKWKYMPNIK